MPGYTHGYRLCSTVKTRKLQLGQLEVCSETQQLFPERPQALTVCGDIYFFWKLSHIHFKPVLNVIKDFGIILI